MSHRLRNAANGGLLRQSDLRALGNPIDFIAEDHMHEREICAVLDQLADGTLKKTALLKIALTFFQDILPFHLADEEQDLFPLMIRRCEPEDRIDGTIERLRYDHAHAREEGPQVIEVLQNCLKIPTSCVNTQVSHFLKTYTSHARRHLIVENAIILPIARARLSSADLTKILINMLKRRGLDRVMGESDAE